MPWAIEFMLKMRLFLFAMFFSLTNLFAQSAHSNLKDPELAKKFKHISEEIMCVCGCNEPLEYCNHIRCIAWGIRDVIDQNLLAGKSEEFIINGFIYGFGNAVHTDPSFALIREKYPEYVKKFQTGFGERYRSYPFKHNPEIIILVIILIFGGIAGIFIKGKFKKLDAAKIQKPSRKSSDSEKEKLYKSLYDDKDDK